MAILQTTNITGRVDGLFLVPVEAKSIASEAVDQIEASFEGFAGDVHTSLTREACVRTKQQYPEGTNIRNVRQVSIVSREELNQIAADMGLPEIKPESLGATMCVSDIPDFTLVPPIFPADLLRRHQSRDRYGERTLCLARQADREKPSRLRQIFCAQRPQSPRRHRLG